MVVILNHAILSNSEIELFEAMTFLGNENLIGSINIMSAKLLLQINVIVEVACMD